MDAETEHSSFGAAVTCVCIQPGGRSDFAMAEGGYDLVVSAREEARQAARAAAENLAYAGEALGVSVETETLGEERGPMRAHLVDRARVHDLVVIEQTSRGRIKPADAYRDDLVLKSGRPILVVPAGWTKPARFDCVTVAWDGSAPAARALSDALPLLIRARRVRVVTVQTEALAGVGEDSHRLIRHLARHGIAAEYRAPLSTAPVIETLLTEAAQAESDLLVMGAYGHSRLREFVLGGASRDALRRITTPVLMAH